jgi:hypothetical protein
MKSLNGFETAEAANAALPRVQADIGSKGWKLNGRKVKLYSFDHPETRLGVTINPGIYLGLDVDSGEVWYGRNGYTQFVGLSSRFLDQQEGGRVYSVPVNVGKVYLHEYRLGASGEKGYWEVSYGDDPARYTVEGPVSPGDTEHGGSPDAQHDALFAVVPLPLREARKINNPNMAPPGFAVFALNQGDARTFPIENEKHAAERRQSGISDEMLRDLGHFAAWAVTGEDLWPKQAVETTDPFFQYWIPLNGIN